MGDHLVSKILIIDDERQALALLSEVLEEAGYDTYACDSAEDGIASLTEKRPDLVLLDMEIEESEGPELLKAMHKADPEVLVIVTSTFESRSKAEEAIANGAYDFLEKPLEVSRVLLAVKNALKTKELKTEVKVLKGRKS
jgi:two-component system nitrogen regulation response regulator NtrX